MPLDQDAITQQLILLATHRRTLAHLLQQAAQFSAGHIPAHIANGIAEARSEIGRIKAYLRENDVSVEDEPNDEVPLALSLAATEAARKIAEQRALDAILETYFRQIEELLVDKNLLTSQPGSGVQHVARTRTLMALRQLDGEHNQWLIVFLRDAGLFGGQHTSIIDLRGADLQGANLKSADLHEVELYRANLSWANLRQTRLRQANLQGANLEGADLLWADLKGVNLRQANLLKANLDGTNLEGADLQEANLQEANLQEANLQGANGQQVNLRFTNLQGANLEGADLEGARLTWANLRGTNLQEANLRGAILIEADLQDANPQGATMPDGRKWEDWLKNHSR